MSQIIHIVEPTLVSEAGHCSIVVQSLCAAGSGLRFCAWVGKEARLHWPQHANVEVKPFFSRRLRRIQAAWLYWRLLRRGERIVITTAGRTDLVLLNLVWHKVIPPGRVFLYVHQLRLNPRKERFLRRLAIKQPNLMLMCTTEDLEQTLNGFGFRHTMVILPLPIPSTSCEGAEPPTTFRHVLIAGAARADKGFHIAVELIHYLAAEGASLPVSIQTSGDHYGRYDEITRNALNRLSEAHYGSLTVLPDTLTRAEYVDLFRGAICIQPYDRAEYANKLSGITLDALMVGAPVVTLSRTWMAKMVEQFEAGVVVEEPTGKALYGAIQMVCHAYEHYSAKASHAGRILKSQNQWASLISLLENDESRTANGFK